MARGVTIAAGEVNTDRDSARPLASARLPFDAPWIALLALPCALVLGGLLQATAFGRLLVYPVQMQFHELGHALAAWLSSRAALPLPFGFTLWREERSLFTGGCLVFLIAVLAHRSLRERRWFGVALALLLAVGFARLSLGTDADRSRMVVIAAGIAGELLLSCLVLIAFYFPLPDRLRWDFFRFVALVPAATGWLGTAALWHAIRRGERPLPMGSILGATGDGSGDLERLIAEYGFTPASITSLYVRLAQGTFVLLALVYGAFALRALRRLGLLRGR